MVKNPNKRHRRKRKKMLQKIHTQCFSTSRLSQLYQIFSLRMATQSLRKAITYTCTHTKMYVSCDRIQQNKVLKMNYLVGSRSFARITGSIFSFSIACNRSFNLVQSLKTCLKMTKFNCKTCLLSLARISNRLQRMMKQ